jgi:hypothetical protein
MTSYSPLKICLRSLDEIIPSFDFWLINTDKLLRSELLQFGKDLGRCALPKLYLQLKNDLILFNIFTSKLEQKTIIQKPMPIVS